MSENNTENQLEKIAAGEEPDNTNWSKAFYNIVKEVKEDVNFDPVSKYEG